MHTIKLTRNNLHFFNVIDDLVIVQDVKRLPNGTVRAQLQFIDTHEIVNVELGPRQLQTSILISFKEA